MEDTAVQQPPVVEPVQDSAPAVVDQFGIDEAKLVSLSPEQRASLSPVFEEWKTRAKGEIEKASKTYQEKYRPAEEKAQALDALIKDQRFVQWWHGLQQSMANQAPQNLGAPGSAQPQDIATPEEWQSAIADAYAGDPTKMKTLQARMFSVMATPVIQQLRAGQEELRTTMEMKNLFESHPDAKDLDKVGYDPNDKEMPSLLETALNLADQRGQSLEWGYNLAKRWSNAMNINAKQEAMGMVQAKKDSVTSGPSTNRTGAVSVVEVDDIDQMMQKAQEFALDNPGKPPPKFVIRPKGQEAQSQRWAQRT